MRKWVFLALAVLFLGGGAAFVWLRGFDWPGSPWASGTVVETLDGVAVYDNGPVFSVSHGRNYAPDGTYFGQKWQCVEFIKRYLYQARGHVMPDGMGHAISFFDADIPQGALNERRGLLQFRQGGSEPPRKGDVIVFEGVAGFGHVAIVAGIGPDSVEIVQQNAPPARTRLALRMTDGYRIESRLKPLGWLRVPSMQAFQSRPGPQTRPAQG